MIGTAVFTRTDCLSSSVTADHVAPSALAVRHAARDLLRNDHPMVTKFCTGPRGMCGASPRKMLAQPGVGVRVKHLRGEARLLGFR